VLFIFFIFFFQAEDGIRDFHVTGVQTCALPISEHAPPMDVLRTAVSYMSGFDPERDDSTQAANMRKALRITAQLATIVATYKRRSEERRVGKECRGWWSTDD